jgi:8-oxo-dGTP diphosphatase
MLELALLSFFAAGIVVVVLLIVRARRRAAGGADKWSSAGGVVVNDRDEIALVLQRGRAKRWRWTLPKGRVDPGETVEVAALREVYEETGLWARIVRPIALHDGDRHFVYYFEMALERDDQRHDAETKEVRFVSVAKAAKLLRSRRDLAVLRRFVEQRTQVKAAVAST